MVVYELLTVIISVFSMLFDVMQPWKIWATSFMYIEYRLRTFGVNVVYTISVGWVKNNNK